MPESVGILREMHRSQQTGQMEVISACDPLNLVGFVTPGERIPAMPGNRIVFRDGVPLAALEKGAIAKLARINDTDLAVASALLRSSIGDQWDQGDEARGDSSSFQPALDATTLLQSNDISYLY